VEVAPVTASNRLLSVGALLALLVYASVATDAALQPDREGMEGSLAGQLLVATPELDDPNFRDTVVYVVHHDRSGAMGLVINRLLGTGPLDRMLEGLGMTPDGQSKLELRVHYGGPVEPSRAFVLHSPDYHSGDTLEVSDIAALTGSMHVLEDIAAGRGPRRSLFVLGYAGWAPGQLENELAAGAWVVVEPDEALLFDEETETKWQRAFDRRGVEL
jgi:putative transcriptional regulator